MQPTSLPNEVILGQWGSFQLSSHRVWTIANDNRPGMFMSMPIDAVESVAIERYHYPLLLALVVLAVLMGLGAAGGSQSGGIAMGMMFAAVVLGAIYFATRKTVLAVYAGSAVMKGMLSGSNAEVDSAMRFLDSVQRQVLSARGTFEQINRNSQRPI